VNNQPFVSIWDLSKTFNPSEPPALDKITLDLPKGHIVGLAGPDGAGKTTFIRLLAGLLLPTTGKITIAGFDTIKDANQIHHIIGYMPQRFGLYEDLTVIQNLTLYADLKGLLEPKRTESFKKLLEFTGLEPFQQRMAHALSGGMKQKLGLACSLLSEPSFLLLDEPSVGVDPLSRRELWKMVRELLNEGITVLWSTSYLDEAERCDTVILLNQGKLIYSGVPKDLTNRLKGRVFQISGMQSSRRQILSRALQQPNVMDGVIQGNDVRVVIKEIQEPPFDLNALEVGGQLYLTESIPRFEDAFVDILEERPIINSILAEKIPEVHSEKKEMVEAHHLTKCFGTFKAADDITFTIQGGEIFGLLGPNGAGKSTTFKMMCGLLKPTAGSSRVNGYDLQHAPGIARSQIGYMAQKFSLYGNLSVYQNLEFFSGIYNLQGKRQQEMVDEMIEVFNFHQFLDTSAENLPLGFKQRLALSCAVMHYPKVLFLDEPTSGVDPITRREFWCHINGLVEKGVTVMVTTHFMEEAEYCDRIGLVYAGKLIKMGTPDTLKKEAATPQNPSPTLEDAFIELIEQYDLVEHG